MRFDGKAFTFESTENRCFGRKSNVNAENAKRGQVSLLELVTSCT